MDKDIKVVHLLPADGEAALARGDIEAYAYPTGFGPLIISKGYKAIDEAKSHPDLRGSSVTVASEDYLSRNPGFVQVWNGVRQKAAKEIQSNADEFYKLYAESSEFPLDVVKASFDISQWQVEDFFSGQSETSGRNQKNICSITASSRKTLILTIGSISLRLRQQKGTILPVNWRHVHLMRGHVSLFFSRRKEGI